MRRADRAETVVSFLSPQQPWGDDGLTSFCHYMLFFASGEAGAGGSRTTQARFC